MINILKKFIGYLLPHFVILFYRKQKEKMEEVLRRRRFEIVASSFPGLPNEFSYKNLIQSLTALGLDQEQIIAGSIPEGSLLDMVEVIRRENGNSSILGLHIGNYVGVSLVYIARLLVELNPDSHILSIDPNIPHRGISNPQEKTLYLIDKFGLSKNVSILTGFTLEKNLSNDARNYTVYDPVVHYRREYSCENQLDLLIKIIRAPFSFAMIDGNHQKQYLLREISSIESLLSKEGLIILDDVSEGWKEIKEVYDISTPTGFEKIFSNNRIGILKKKKS